MVATSTAPRAALDRDIASIQTELLRLGDKVDRALDLSIEALLTYSPRIAQEVIAGDQHLNAQRYRIEAQCLATIARQQPAARDLRYIIAAMHAAGELERMGDHAAGIATLALQLGTAPTLPNVIDLRRMSQATRQMLRSGLNAFVLNNAEQAQRTYQMDDLIDQYHQQIVRTLLTYMLEDRSVIGEATYLIWVAHNLERIGDRVTNLCERTAPVKAAAGDPR